MLGPSMQQDVPGVQARRGKIRGERKGGRGGIGEEVCEVVDF